jgi:hypothetical protein
VEAQASAACEALVQEPRRRFRCPQLFNNGQSLSYRSGATWFATGFELNPIPFGASVRAATMSGPIVMIHIGHCDLIDNALAIIPRRLDKVPTPASVEEYGTS